MGWSPSARGRAPHEGDSGRRRRLPASLQAGALALGVVAVGGGIAYATIPHDGIISACYLKSGGALRVIDATTSKCSPRETSLNWNVQGVQGPPGADGADGAPGADGADGADGTDGVSGYEIVKQSGQSNGLGAGAHSVSANCPAGKVPTGGGGEGTIFKDIVGFPADMRASVLEPPEFDGDLYGWKVTFGDFDGTPISPGETLHWSVTVICVNEVDATQ